jgi:hypothetical protein
VLSSQLFFWSIVLGPQSGISHSEKWRSVRYVLGLLQHAYDEERLLAEKSNGLEVASLTPTSDYQVTFVTLGVTQKERHKCWLVGPISQSIVTLEK